MAIQVFVGDLYGWVLAEMSAGIGPVSWQLDKTGKTTLTLSKSDPKYTSDTVKLGNRVLIRFDNGLPMWGGTMEVPWTETPGEMMVTGLGIENLLYYRITRKNRAFYNTPVGSIFASVILEAQTYQSLGIELGSLWLGGCAHSPRYHFKRVLDVIQNSICAMELCDFAFLPQLMSHRISFLGELYLQRGQDKSSSVVLLEKVNVGDPVMKWQGPVVNHFASIGAGSTWGDERQVSIKEEIDSLADYGLREDSEVYTGVVYSTTLDTHAETVLKQQAQPSRKISLNAVNLAPALFASYDIGDIVRLVLPSFNYDHSVRLLTREYDPSSGKCALVVEEPSVVEPSTASMEDEA